MNTIEFDKNYTKLPAGIKTARLVACESVKLQDLTLAFINYDTEYRVGKVIMWGELREAYLKGENPALLCNILKSDSGAIFTTLRKDNAENREKYMMCTAASGWESCCSKEFQIIIKEE